MNKTMGKRMVRAALVIIVLGSDMLLHAATSQFRVPLNFIKHGSIHYPLGDIEDAWWFDNMGCVDTKKSPWHIESFKGLYVRSASQSFFDKCHPCENKVTHKTVSLSTLWFGQEAFRGEDVFPGGMLKDPCDPALQRQENISLGFSRITPRFEYNEYGVYCGVDMNRHLGECDQWRIGVRASIPIKVITIERDQDQQLYETVDDVVRMRRISEDGGPGANQFDFAARGDFINTLSYKVNVNGEQQCIPFVQYGNSNAAVRVAGFPVAGLDPINPAISVFAVGRPDGSLPDQPYRKTAESGATALPVSGVLADNKAAFFEMDRDYGANLGSDRNAQGALFIVPKAAPADNALTNQASAVSDRLRSVVEQINGLGVNSPVNFFRESGNINLGASERITGQGDLFTEIYGGYHLPTRFIEGIVGLRFPTGTKTDKVNRIFLQSTGNNGHVELKLGVDGGLKVCDWFAFEIDGAYYRTFNRTEQRAAPYKGATVKNIGPQVGVDIAWNAFTAHVNLNFFHPHNADLGCTFGYDFSAKMKNSVCIKCPPPDDLLGRPNDTLPLSDQGYDPKLLSDHTDTMTHKLCGEVFHRWSFCEIFAGAGQVIAGRNAMKESDAYIGMKVYF